MRLRFIHAADLHLDSPFKGLQNLPPHIRHRLIQSTFEAFENVVQLAIHNKVDFVLFAGDIYDRADRSLKAQLAFMEGLERLSEQGIHSFIVHGNHDPLDGFSFVWQPPERVHFFSAEQVEKASFYKNGTEAAHIYGISYPTAKVDENLSHRFKRENQDIFSVALLHTNCGGAKEHENYAPCTKQDLLRAGFDYWALGHVHQRQIIHQQPPMIYPGNIQGRHIREQGEKGVYLIDVDEGGHISFAFHASQKIVWLERKVDISGIEQMDQLFELLTEERMNLRNKYPAYPLIVRLKCRGITPLAQHLSRREIIQTMVTQWNEAERDKSEFVWLESFHFVGQGVFDRDAGKESHPLLSELFHLVDLSEQDTSLRKRMMREGLSELLDHFRIGNFLEPWDEVEERELIKRAEALLLLEMGGLEEK